MEASRNITQQAIDLLDSDDDDDHESIILVDNADESSDLSDGEWEEAKQVFQKLRDDKYKMWDGLAAAAQSRSTSRQRPPAAAQATTTLREGTNRRTSPNQLQRRPRSSAAAAACQDACCLPKSFVPIGLLKQNDKAPATDNDLVNRMKRLEVSTARDTKREQSSDEEDDLIRESDDVCDDDDGSSSDSNEAESSDDSVVRFDHISFEPSPPRATKVSSRGNSGDNDDMLVDAVTIQAAALPGFKGAANKGAVDVLEIDSDSDDDEELDKVFGRVPAHTFQKRPLRTHQPIVLEIDSESNDDNDSWSPPECQSPRFASPNDGPGDDDDHDQEQKTTSNGDSESDNPQTYSMPTRKDGDKLDDSESSSENTWNGSLGEEVEDEIRVPSRILDQPRPIRRNVIVVDSDDDADEDGEGEVATIAPAKTPAVKPRRSRVPPSTGKSKSSFDKSQEPLSKTLFEKFDRQVFDGKLSAAGVELSWSKRLSSTAGKTILKRGRGSHGDIYKADIQLSATILDREARLRSTLLHEMCHAAAWIEDHNDSPPHGSVFRKWAKLAHKRTGVAVTTTHSYSIDKYAWACTTAKCPVKILRPTRSFKPDAVVCAKCGGNFVEVDMETGEPVQAKEKRAPSKYNLFVKEHAQAVRVDLEASGLKVSQPEVMAELAQRWKKRSDP